jgi:hypothetical protein
MLSLLEGDLFVNDYPLDFSSPSLSTLPVGGRLQFYATNWEEITSDQWVLSTIREGYTIEFARPPPLNPISIMETFLPKDPTMASALTQEVQSLLDKKAIEMVNLDIQNGFFS